MNIHRTPWHALTVTRTWYCDQPGPDAIDKPCRDEDGWCTGHSEEAPGLRSEIEHDLTHPAGCGSRTDFLECPTADLVCDDGNESLPMLPGAYRVRAWVQPADGPIEGPRSGLECESTTAGGLQ